LTIPDRGPTVSGDSDHARKVTRAIREAAGTAFKSLVRLSKVRLYGTPGLQYCDLSHIAGFEPVLSLQHQNVMHASLQALTLRIRTMTRYLGLSIMTVGAALSMTAGLAAAGDTVSADKILDALKPKVGATRGLSTGPQQPVDATARAKEINFVDSLRNRKTRSLSLGERQEIAELAASKPKIDLEIQFDYNSADISKNSVSAVRELGKALSDASLKGSTFVVAGHTDAIGGEAYNQDLSERRADTIKKYLTEQYGIAGANLVTVGYGKTRPKDPNAPMDPTNRRVQVVNMDTKTASK
jgi:outer membrane protein OmpA-like peptidoglycan-associated protein